MYELYLDIIDSRVKKIIIYLLVGGFTFVLYYFLLWMLFDFFGIIHIISVTFSYLFSSIFHFIANRNITFNISRKTYSRQIFRYLSVAFLNYIIQLAAIVVLYDFFNLNLYLSALIGISITIVCGFMMLNNWVFMEE